MSERLGNAGNRLMAWRFIKRFATMGENEVPVQTSDSIPALHLSGDKDREESSAMTASALREIFRGMLFFVLWLGVTVSANAETRSRIVVSADGSVVAAASDVSQVHLYTGDSLEHLQVVGKSAYRVGLSPDGRILGAFGGKELEFYESATGEKIKTFPARSPVVFSDDGKWCLAREAFPGKDGLLIEMKTAEVKHRFKNIKGAGFSSDEKHCVVVRESRENSRSKNVKILMQRYTLEDAKPGEPVEIQAKVPDTRYGSIRPIKDAYLFEMGGHFWTVTEEGSTADHGLFKPQVYSGAPGNLLLGANFLLVEGKQGVQIGFGRNFDELKESLAPEKGVFLQLIDNPDLPKHNTPDIKDLTLHGQDYYLVNDFGSVIKLDAHGKVVAFGDREAPADATVLLAKSTEQASDDSPSGLAEIHLRTSKGDKVELLKPKANRLRGGFKAKISKVGEELDGASFTVAPWKAKLEYSITVTKPGYLYLMKGSVEEREKTGLNWELRPEAVSGSYLKGAYRVQVEKDQKIEISGYELSVIAGKIVLE